MRTSVVVGFLFVAIHLCHAHKETKSATAPPSFGTFFITPCGENTPLQQCQSQYRRRKRDVSVDSSSSAGPDILFGLTTFDDDNNNGELLLNEQFRLRRSPSIIAPNYELVVRGKINGTRTAAVDDKVPYPTCLYDGASETGRNEIALSVCRPGKMSASVLLESGKQLTVEQLHPKHLHYDGFLETRKRKRRFALETDPEPDLREMVVIFESAASGGECGIKPKNLQKMKAPRQKVVDLRDEEEEQKDDGETFVRRKKRASDDDNEVDSSRDKAIELAVFVDEYMYRRELDLVNEYGGDIEYAIQDLVFTYLISVQLLYNSPKLDTRLRIVLIRLEIFTDDVEDLDPHDGDIEDYLESFCSWQLNNNPGDLRFPSRADREKDKHWDHALLLTGLNLYDRDPKYDTVIGLAWVAGMCHPKYSCTINEGNNFESVFVIAHEMGHNLGMNHDGESSEGNNCSPDKFLMSPVLGPGKVRWSSCSNREISDFITGRKNVHSGFLYDTSDQAKCLNDLPKVMEQYDYLSAQKLPGILYSALEQCVKAFGEKFVPHVKSDSPYEDLCRELWCANDSHALRAHPALEGTDCSSKPYPYGSICKRGVCSPYNPNKKLVLTYGGPPQEKADDDEDRDHDADDADRDTKDATDAVPKESEPLELIDGRPKWYDPIFTRIFANLKEKYSERFPHNGKKVLSLHRNVASVEFFDANYNSLDASRWIMSESEPCPVECGGGWTEVDVSCRKNDEIVEEADCDFSLRPNKSKTICNIHNC